MIFGLLFWLPRVTLGRLFRPLNPYLDTIEADIAWLVQMYKEANPK